jgi:ABC-type uncharacterized transport system permease subunit
MRLALERRSERSLAIALLSPLLAIALTLATGAALFALLGKPPLQARCASISSIRSPTPGRCRKSP